MNKVVDLYKATVDDEDVRNVFRYYATVEVNKKYARIGKSTLTQSGNYRSQYINDIDKLTEMTMQRYCDKDVFKREFADFVLKQYRSTTICNIVKAFSEYEEHLENKIKSDAEAERLQCEKFIDSSESITVDTFFNIRKEQQGDIVGVYVIHNKTKDIYYVGQAKKLFSRVNQHFTGHGNGDVYADYKYGDEFTVKIVRLSRSGYDDLDLLEKDLIKKYNAYENGYNKTAGNG